MDELEKAKPPGQVQAIGFMHLIGGILNILSGLFWALYGAMMGLATFGIGLVACCPFFILVPIGIIEIISGAKHLSSNHAGLKPPKAVGIIEIASILGCMVPSTVMGILTLVFLNDPEVQAYYNKTRYGA